MLDYSQIFPPVYICCRVDGEVMVIQGTIFDFVMGAPLVPAPDTRFTALLVEGNKLFDGPRLGSSSSNYSSYSARVNHDERTLEFCAFQYGERPGFRIVDIELLRDFMLMRDFSYKVEHHCLIVCGLTDIEMMRLELVL